ncbi:kinase-like domain-containing protein [Sporodiniella umbellata]|nr:kinase-like domain-containing protein [Sporodiniella umbellata]
MPFMMQTASQVPIPTENQKSTVTIAYKKPKEIGSYFLGKTIGHGASGKVKLGIHKHTGVKVAMKMIPRSDLLSSTVNFKCVQRELAVLQLLNHPNIVSLHQVLQDADYIYFAMEYMEGGELFHYLDKKEKLEESEARLLFTQLITALNWCHAHQISHRDLKPENILLDKQKKTLKIADFGMAALQHPAMPLKTSCGSPHYASPEIVKGKHYDGRATDVWSCGVILYVLMTGHLPFDDERIKILLEKIKLGTYSPLPTTLSKDLQELVQNMLLIDPKQRITTSEILAHPWLNSQFFLGTELRFLQPNKETFKLYPLESPQLQKPIIVSDLESRVWETLRVLWKKEQELFFALSSEGSNMQKLTCKLLQDHFLKLDNFIESNDSVHVLLKTEYDSLSISPPFSKDISVDTSAYLLPTPKSTVVFHHKSQPLFMLKQFETKSGPAEHFIVTEHVKTTPKTVKYNPIWNIIQKKPSSWEKLYRCFGYRTFQKVVRIECKSKTEYEVTGKLHQVLAECFQGKLIGRMHSDKRITWGGILTIEANICEFVCLLSHLDSKTICIDMLINRGLLDLFEHAIDKLVYRLNTYEAESKWLMYTNDW